MACVRRPHSRPQALGRPVITATLAIMRAVALVFILVAPTRGFVSRRLREPCHRRARELCRPAASESEEYEFSSEDLIECDVVEYSLAAGGTDGDRGIACVLRDGSLQPLCTWAVDGEDFVWDEELSPVPKSRARAYVEPAPFLSSRLVDGGIGPNNPHGEESEEVYRIDRAAISDGVVVVHRPDREVWW